MGLTPQTPICVQREKWRNASVLTYSDFNFHITTNKLNAKTGSNAHMWEYKAHS